MSKATKYKDTSVEVDGQKIPVRIFIERRSSMRVAIGKRHVILRMPMGIFGTDVKKGLKWVREWLSDLNADKKGLLHRIAIKEYRSGQQLKVGDRTYQLHISHEKRNNYTARMIGSNIYLRLSAGGDEVQLQRAIKHLLSRVVAKDFFSDIEKRVFYWNDRYFNCSVNKVRLKYTTSNWGSRSTKGNINLSTRLLFAPPSVIDYVIIHELAHFFEQNHSAAFWKIVADVMPSYQQKEAWLKENSYWCDF